MSLSKENTLTQEQAMQIATGLSEHNAEGIRKIISLLSDDLNDKIKEEVKVLYAEMLQEVKKLNFETVEEFLAEAQSQGLVKAPSTKKTKVVPIRYRDTDLELAEKNTWTGRGKKPVWLQNYINEGRDLSEFLVEKEGEAEAETEA